MGTSWGGDVDTVDTVSFDATSVAADSFGITSVVDGLDWSKSALAVACSEGCGLHHNSKVWRCFTNWHSIVDSMLLVVFSHIIP